MNKEDLIKLDIEECAGQYCAYLDDIRISKAKPVGVMHNIHSINCRKDYIKEVLGIPKGAVVLSKEEYERLKRIELEKDRLYEIKLDLENQLIQSGLTEYIGADEIEKQARKETAKEILETILEESGIDILEYCYKLPTRIFNKIKAKYGVKVEK